MDTAVIVGIVAALLCAGGVFVVMEYRFFGLRQQAGKQVLQHQTEASSLRKDLLGYTKYAEYLPVAKTHLGEHARDLQVKIVREFTYTETFNKDAKTLKAPVTIIQRYNVDAQFAFDQRGLELEATGSGLQVSLHGKPMLLGIANSRPVSHEITNEGVLDNEPVTVKQIQQKLIAIAQKHAEAIAVEEATCALCERKLAETLRSVLITQAGVKQVPAITFVYK